MEADAQAKIDAEVQARNAQFRAEQEASNKAQREADAKAHAEYEAGMMAEQAKIAALQKVLDEGEEIEARRKAAQIAEQSKPFPVHDTTSLMPTVRTMEEDRADLEGDTITIRTSEYHRLCEDALMLSCLRAAGVDNWEGWGDAMDDYHQSMEAA